MSSKDLVIVESPAKARTIGRLLGGAYNVMASMGHVRDLPERTLGVDIADNFKPAYELVKKRGVVPTLKEHAKNASVIYLASDPDREGEAIAWHIQEVLKKGCKADFKRVVFHEITSSAVKKAFQHPGKLDMNLVESQQARRILDRIVGYRTSEFLWKKVERGSSAGRVQSVALRVICERERLVLDFKPQEYWNIFVDFEVAPQGSGMKYRGKLSSIDGQKPAISCTDTALRVSNAVKNGGPASVSNLEIKDRKKFAPPPFITSTLQQSASSYLRFSASHTMSVAQALYEGIELGSGPTGLITYMRTDSVSIANEAIESARSFISTNIGREYLPQFANRFKSNSRAQEAHEAIRPTDVNRTPEDMRSFLNSDQLRLYTLIWKRFVACQMKPQELKVTTLESSVKGADGSDYRFKTAKTETVFLGYSKIYDSEAKEAADSDEEGDTQNPPAEKIDLAFLSTLKPGNSLFMLNTESEQKFTEPPPRFSEATLIKELESNGIGRPSTYATIVNTIQKRKYVDRTKGKLIPTELGFKVNDCLVGAMSSLFDIGFTAKMENELDDVEEGKLGWTEMLSEFYAKFASWLGDAKASNVPGKEVVEKLLAQFGAVQEWDAEPSLAKRKNSDKEFFDSLKENYAEASRLTDRQWKALVMLAARYRSQLPKLQELAVEGGFAEDLDSATSYSEKIQASIESGEQKSKLDEQKKILGEIMAEMKEKEKESPAEDKGFKKGRFFDEGKFVRSLKRRLDSGAVLTEKQFNALMNVGKRKNAPPASGAADANSADSASGLVPQSAGNSPEQKEKIERALAILGNVKEWKEPTRKGKRVYDDKAFYSSINDQYRSGRSLSPKQIFAIEKMSGNYLSGKAVKKGEEGGEE